VLPEAYKGLPSSARLQCYVFAFCLSSYALAKCLTNIRSVLDGPGFNEENGYGRGGARRPVRKERDDKVHDSIIEERIQRERPCRTLFIRNIKASHFRGKEITRPMLISC
jgi:hypothetical protein